MWESLIPLGVTAASSLGSYFSTMQTQNSQIKAEDRAWNRETAYNHPSAQMQRMKEAGMNPNLMYGSNVASGNTHAPMTQRHPYSYSDKMQQYLMFENAVQQNELLSAQTKNMDAETAYKLKEAKLLGEHALRNDPVYLRLLGRLIGGTDGSFTLESMVNNFTQGFNKFIGRGNKNDISSFSQNIAPSPRRKPSPRKEFMWFR